MHYGDPCVIKVPFSQTFADGTAMNGAKGVVVDQGENYIAVFVPMRGTTVALTKEQVEPVEGDQGA